MQENLTMSSIIFRLIFRPFGVYLGLKANPFRPPATNNVLEAEYQNKSRPIPENRDQCWQTFFI